MPDEDLRAWNLVAGALDEALALDLDPGTRGALLRMRACTSFLRDRPRLEAAAEPAPVDNLYELPGQPGGAA
jgi:hypothetical protein